MIGTTNAVDTAAIPDVADDGAVLKAFDDAGRKC